MPLANNIYNLFYAPMRSTRSLKAPFWNWFVCIKLNIFSFIIYKINKGFKKRFANRISAKAGSQGLVKNPHKIEGEMNKEEKVNYCKGKMLAKEKQSAKNGEAKIKECYYVLIK